MGKTKTHCLYIALIVMVLEEKCLILFGAVYILHTTK